MEAIAIPVKKFKPDWTLLLEQMFSAALTNTSAYTAAFWGLHILSRALMPGWVQNYPSAQMIRVKFCPQGAVVLLFCLPVPVIQQNEWLPHWLNQADFDAKH